MERCRGMVLTEYEVRALEEIRAHKDRMAARQARSLVPESVRDRTAVAGGAIRDRASKVPGFDKAAAGARAGYLQAVSGLGRAVNASSRLSLSEQRLLKAYARRGHDLDDLAEIRALDLHTVEKRAMPNYMSFIYSSAAAVEGAASGLLVTGGEILAEGGALAGAGAGAAPGIGTVTATVAVDAAAVLALCTRVVGHTAMYYGYDPRDPGEAVFALGVINLGTAVSGAGKYAAYTELSRITQLLARNATWAALNKSALPRVMNKFAAAFGVRLTKRKLGMLIPVIGIGVGAGLNYYIVDQVADAAYWTYRERFLNEKQGITTLYVPEARAYDDAGQGEPDVGIDLLAIVDEAAQEAAAEDGRDAREPGAEGPDN
jgi:hypothetical protein